LFLIFRTIFLIFILFCIVLIFPDHLPDTIRINHEMTKSALCPKKPSRFRTRVRRRSTQQLVVDRRLIRRNSAPTRTRPNILHGVRAPTRQIDRHRKSPNG